MKKCIIGLVFVVCAVLLFGAAGVQSQTKSDLPEGYAEPTELPAGAITLEELDRRRAQKQGGATEGMAPAAPESMAEPMPATPPPPPPVAAPEPMPPDTAMPPPSPPPAAAPASAPRTTVGDTRAAPVDWSKAPPEASGMDATPSAPAPMTPAPAAPPMASPAPAAPTAGPGYSDLPEGYAEPTELPPGAVRLEDLQSPYDTMPEPTPQMPGMQESAPPPAAPQPADEVEMVGDDMDEQDSYMPPSRWE